MNIVRGHCPSCGKESLIVLRQVLRCRNPECSEPSALDVILSDDNLSAHLVTLGPGQNFTTLHPLIERLHDLRDCELHRLIGIVADADQGWVVNRQHDALEPGEYRVTKVATQERYYEWEPVA